MTHRLDTLTRTLTAFASFRALVDAPNGYRPSLSTCGSNASKRRALADAYDAAQSERGDARRASRF